MQLHGSVAAQKFWIDSICINQADNDEKSTQVGFMGRIYQSAHAVAACLGTNNHLQILRTAMQDGQQAAITRAMHTLDELVYFDRLWIKQEIVLAQNVKFFCGLDVMRWQEVAKVLNLSGYDKSACAT